MAECRLVHEIGTHPTMGSVCVAICICHTHGMKLEGPMRAGARCPVGQIEYAVERGIERIQEALANKG